MNWKKYLLSLGIDELIKLYKDKGFNNFGEFLTSILGVEVKSYGILDNGILLESSIWDLLENKEMIEK